ncbi:MAG: GSCFA domain-containing protein [Bergeyella zoohelcum]|nr:GSCFA domain-containing protein [Bergeyella zoohelcum]
MIFRTEINIPISDKKIEVNDKIFTIGSCFATEMSQRFSEGQLQTMSNPFGTIFNPFSINKNLLNIVEQKRYDEGDLVRSNGQYISLDHHTNFDDEDMNAVLRNINQSVAKSYSFLRETSWVLVTYGTSFIYEFLVTGQVVANCHKIPNKHFQKRLLTQQEIYQSVKETISLLKRLCRTDVRILFTVSPVRHTKDGMVENQLSKSKLITAIHEAISEEKQCQYLPIYEIMMDDLRDYRFYNEDMIHPNNQAIKYIFEKFGNAYFSAETQDFMQENFKIHQALLHRPKDETSEKYQDFLQKINERIAQQQQKVKHQIF